MSMPFSIIEVESNTSYSWFIKSISAFSKSSGFICPCAITTRQSGTCLRMMLANSGRFAMRSFTKYTCPLRLISKLMASAMNAPSNVAISVCMGWRFGGGVRITLMSRAPINENCNVRGMGVADMVSVSTLVLSVRSFSLVDTPNFCSSSMISSPKSCHFTVFPISLCVPMMMSILPAARSSSTCRVCFAERARDK